MLMPTKHINTENALIGVGAIVLSLLDQKKTVSKLFFELQAARKQSDLPTIHFDWFVLALDFLFSIGAIEYSAGLIEKRNDKIHR